MKKLLPILVIVMLFVAGGTTYYAYSVYTGGNDKDIETVKVDNEDYSVEQLEILSSTEKSLNEHYQKGEYLYAIESFKNVFKDSSLIVEPTDEILEIYNKVVYTYFDSIDKFNGDIHSRVQQKWLSEENIELINSRFNNEITLYEQEKIIQQEEEEKRKEQIDKEKRAKEGVRIGMTAEEVLMSNWGTPRDINKTTTTYGTREQWVYRNNNYLYFEDGILVTIQN